MLQVEWLDWLDYYTCIFCYAAAAWSVSVVTWMTRSQTISARRKDSMWAGRNRNDAASSATVGWREHRTWTSEYIYYFFLLYCFLSFILISLLCGVDVRWYSPLCSTVVHFFSRHSLLFDIIFILTNHVLYFLPGTFISTALLPT